MADVDARAWEREEAEARREARLAGSWAASLGVGSALPPARYWAARLGLERWAFLLLASTAAALLAAAGGFFLGHGPAIAGLVAGYVTAGGTLAVLTRPDDLTGDPTRSPRQRWQAFVDRRAHARRRLADAEVRLREAAAIAGAARHRERLALGVDRVVGVDPSGLDWETFEQWVADILRVAGFATEVTRGTGDQGIDVIAEFAGHRVAIQAKRYARAAGNDAVQQAVAGRAVYGCGHAAVFCTGGFTSAARELAAANRTWLADLDAMRLLQQATHEHFARRNPADRPLAAQILDVHFGIVGPAPGSSLQAGRS